jgi:hypothetical protein
VPDLNRRFITVIGIRDGLPSGLVTAWPIVEGAHVR